MEDIEGNCVYELRVIQELDNAVSDHRTRLDELEVRFKFRKFESQSRDPTVENEQTLEFPRTRDCDVIAALITLMSDIDIPERILSNMRLHLGCFLRHGILRRHVNTRGLIIVSVKLDIRVMSDEQLANYRRSWNEYISRDRAARREVDVATIPAKKASVEGLERVLAKRVEVEDDKVCVICLERFVEGIELIRMPCNHLYHSSCIVKWLDRSHFCPYCRFKLPC